jgi:hypothetical protein
MQSWPAEAAPGLPMEAGSGAGRQGFDLPEHPSGDHQRSCSSVRGIGTVEVWFV